MHLKSLLYCENFSVFRPFYRIYNNFSKFTSVKGHVYALKFICTAIGCCVKDPFFKSPSFFLISIIEEVRRVELSGIFKINVDSKK